MQFPRVDLQKGGLLGMNQALSKRLNDIGITREGIVNLIGAKKGMTVVMYASCMEGLGTRASDIDIYVIGDKVNTLTKIENGTGIKMLELDSEYYGITDIGYLYFDIQYWETAKVEENIEKVKNNSYIGFEELKLLQRLLIGEVLHKGDFDIKNRLEMRDLQQIVIKRYSVACDTLLDDCTTLYRGNELYGAVECGRKALNYVIAAYNASKGKINLKPDKWSSKIFLELDIPIEEKTEFKYYMYGKVEFTLKYVESLIIYIQTFLNKRLGYTGKKHWIKKEMFVMRDESDEILYRI